MDKITIGKRKVGEGEPCFIIAEAGSNHDGRLAQAKRLIDIAAGAGADAVKFQSFRAEKLFNEVSHKGVVDMLTAMEVQESWHGELRDYAKGKDIVFLSSAFDEKTADMLDRLGIPAHKIASYEMTHAPLLEHVARQGKPIILSTGMATEKEIGESLKAIEATGNRQVALLHCVSQYPATPENVNLRSMVSLKKFGKPVGFSDHTLNIYAPVAAVALGACIIEKHFTISRLIPGPDHPYALEPDALKAMVSGIREVELELGSGEIGPAACEKGERLYRRAVFASQDIPAGTVITKDMTMIVRPAPEGSLTPGQLKDIVGKKLKTGLKKGDHFTPGMV
ncbi:MAG TPA: N-acetylneuraminate synthase family protein [Methanocella sp.]